MIKTLPLTLFLFLSSFIAIYPLRKENIGLINYCYSLEKILSKNSLEKNKNISKKYKTFANDITSFGTKKTKGALVNKMIDQYKASKKFFIINIVPNQIFCLAGYWIEELNPGTFHSFFYEISKEKINQYKNVKKEFDEFLNDINDEYKYIKKEINNFF
ncbi:MAG: carbon storage regulator CsrA [Prochlorococcus marinus CUG1438]|nr:carbon storage regulator CsrA [Prochlorococcus marinus CUG1438]